MTSSSLIRGLVPNSASGATCDPGANCANDVGRLVARIEGALGSAILVGLDRLSVCRCGNPALASRTPREPWSYRDVQAVSIGDYKSLQVVLIELAYRIDPLPILVLERSQVEAAIDGLVTLRRLVAAAAGARVHATHNLISA